MFKARKTKGNIAYSLGFTALAAGFALMTAPMTADASEVLENNEDVEQLQEKLNDRGLLDDADVTGEYNAATTDAVTTYQEEHNLLTDGLAGVQTLGALSKLTLEDEGDLVEELQSELQANGYDPTYVDGKFGPLTEDALVEFQSDAGIAADGIAGPDTFSNLMYNGAPTKETEPVTETEETASAETESTSEESTTNNTENETSGGTESPEGATMTMEATAYTAECEGCSGITATGINLLNDRNANVVAVDPNVIPLGSTVYVEGYGEAIAGDTGGAINGNKIDLHMATTEEALNFGRQSVEVTVLD
ncbi:peptidoglycan-binding protein [Geomicrobium sp. JCM 19039]|uniref:peptidoglycan-binding protein n=1 Tax=Geomicrobium sp. JCM 19039 TaxID=1460636 RepID=UPI00045F3779|nr:peptidoglycan-binding protein [Geomicrobium sp. JCM 19039]GAK14547.1 cell wall-binding protein [Geomicrobium sp. JCM 19039]